MSLISGSDDTVAAGIAGLTAPYSPPTLTPVKGGTFGVSNTSTIATKKAIIALKAGNSSFNSAKGGTISVVNNGGNGTVKTAKGAIAFGGGSDTLEMGNASLVLKKSGASAVKLPTTNADYIGGSTSSTAADTSATPNQDILIAGFQVKPNILAVVVLGALFFMFWPKR